ncbi:hypothetical protein HMPREF0765_0016 [Sphingobacterium spiritivorum ATCC 33300]|uniref:Uncharacterized protein n=1 Tax=Sphingobacterium spiritivorum ATCC 33300 TaxID=525372 RepID=C2FRR0_SPHSI|nr:hypothetical protein HMPREF0765_0016 [Sphingobacterium spiritivorum ATCC 33300]
MFMQTFVKSIARLKNPIILIKNHQFYINYSKDITKRRANPGGGIALKT